MSEITESVTRAPQRGGWRPALTLAILAYFARRVGTGKPHPARGAPPPWLVVLLAFALGFPFWRADGLCLCP